MDDLLGAVALAYNATVHTTTGYSLHELFYSFAPSCPLDAMVSTPASDPVSNADEFALQTFERLQEATAFVRQFTGKNMKRMKHYYDSSVKPQSYSVGGKVLVYNPRKQRGKFAKWQICWRGPFVVERKLNDTNYVLRKGKGKAIVIHIDRMQKLPIPPDSESSDHSENDKQPTIQPTKRHKATHAANTGTHCMDITSRADTADRHPPLIQPTDNTDSLSHNVCKPVGLDTCDPQELLSQSADATTAEPESVTTGSAINPLPHSDAVRHIRFKL